MCKTIKQRVRLAAPPDRVYRLLADSRLHSEFTGRQAKIGKRVGQAFSTDDGQVTGVNIDLVPAQRIVQAWRGPKFGDGIFSMVAFELRSTPDGGTELTLTHRGVPKELIPQTELRWKEGYWNKLREYLARR